MEFALGMNFFADFAPLQKLTLDKSVTMMYIIPAFINARVVELVDSLDSGSSVQFGHAGSSPASRTMLLKTVRLNDLAVFPCI